MPKIEFTQYRDFDGDRLIKFVVEGLDDYCDGDPKPSDRAFYGKRQYVCSDVPINTRFSFHRIIVFASKREDSHYLFAACEVTGMGDNIYRESGGEVMGSFRAVVIARTAESVMRLMREWKNVTARF